MTKTKDECKTSGLCHYDSSTRNKFFHGMLLTDDHLSSEQTYHREALKRNNRYLLGSGIVCGLEVDRKDLCVQVHPGAALDCGGNLIEVCQCITIDFWEDCKKKYPEGCLPQNAQPITKYLVLRYAEIPADMQPVLSSSEDCPSDTGQTKCQASKIREGFCLELVDKCPKVEACPDKEGPLAAYLSVLKKSLGEKGAREAMQELTPDFMKLSPPCPGCECGDCDGCEVCLAKLTINCGEKTVTVDGDCRRYVWSPRMLQWMVCAVLARLDRNIDIKNLPTSNELVYQTLPVIWRGAMEFVAAQSRPTGPVKPAQEEVAVAAEQAAPVKPKVKAKPTEEPKAKPTEAPKVKPTEAPKVNP
jgi:hypothetical protein